VAQEIELEFQVEVQQAAEKASESKCAFLDSPQISGCPSLEKRTARASFGLNLAGSDKRG
jgi:hypothetical protein